MFIAYTRIKGCFYILVSSFLISIISVVAKKLNRFISGQYNAMVGYPMFHLSVALSLYKRPQNPLYLFDKKILVGIQSSLRAMGRIICIFCVINMPIGDAVTLMTTYPIFVGLLGRLFLKESYGMVNVTSAIIGKQILFPFYITSS